MPVYLLFGYNNFMKLKAGDTIGIISPSGAISNREIFFQKVEDLKALGYKVKIFPNVFNQKGYLAGDDSERLEDLHSAFSDDEVNAILCSRGGYGAIRLLDKIDYNIIKNNPKIFMGSSDATALLIAFYARADLAGYHTLMLLNGFSKNDIDLINNQKEILPKKKHKVFTQGSASGVLWGGNLSTIVSLFGSYNYLPEKDIILFLEDINEPLYKIDKMLIQIFRNSRLREKIKAVIFGEFTGLAKDESKKLENILFEYSKMLNIPCVYGYDITHGKNNIALPFGRCTKLLGAKIYLL